MSFIVSTGEIDRLGLSVPAGSMTVMTDTMLPITAQPPAVVGAARELVIGLESVLWAGRSPVELLDTVRACEVLRSTVDAVELAVVAEIEATNAATVQGWASTTDYVTAVTGGLTGAGRRLLALARAVTSDRAVTGAALAAGDLSRVQAEVVVAAVDRLPVDPPLRDAAERLLLELARDHDATDLTAAGRRVVERLDPDGTDRRDEAALQREERAAHRSRFLSISQDGIGGVRVKGRGTVEDAAHLTAVLFSLAAPQPTSQPGACGGAGAGGGASVSCGVPDCAHDGRDPRDHGARMWDALIEATRLLAATEVLPTSHGTRPRVSVMIDYHALATSVRTSLGTGLGASLGASLGVGTIDTGGTLSAAAVRTLACDAEILPFVLGSRSQILDVGRTSRLVTPGIWLALITRDRHCAFPGVRREALVERVEVRDLRRRAHRSGTVKLRAA